MAGSETATPGVARHWIVDIDKRELELYDLAAGDYRLVGTRKNEDKLAAAPSPDLTIDSREIWP